MRSKCEVCGRELGFFERSPRIEDNKLGILYTHLCSSCYHQIREAISKINDISSKVISELSNKYDKYPYARNDINLLTFLTVSSIFEELPNYNNPENVILSTFYPDDESYKTNFDYLIEITYKVLRNSFISVLGRYGFDTFEAFAGYMGHDSLFFDQVQSNCGEDGELTYSDIFVNASGMVFFDQEQNIVRTLFISQDRTYRFKELLSPNTFDIEIQKQRYNNLKARPLIKFNRKDQCLELKDKLVEFNSQKSERIESELDALINSLNVQIEKDLRRMHPDDQIVDIPFDSVLVCILKTLFEQDITQDYVKEAPDGLLSLIVEKCYMPNFERSGMSSIDEIQDYLSDACTIVSGLRSSFGRGAMHNSFAFLTPRAYMINQLDNNQAFLISKDELPNKLYTDYQYMIYQGREDFFIPIAKSEETDEGYYFLDGIRIHSKNKRNLKELEGYFKENALNYFETELENQKDKNDYIREDEITDTARRIFVGYGYLPFCIYDEWDSIERNIRESDILMQKLIPQRKRKTSAKSNKVFYTSRTVNNFEKQASNLAESLDIEKLPVARALLWERLQEEIISNCSEEFIRLAGDFVDEGDSLNEALMKYSGLTSIETQKAYYLGLFIYYLINKNFFETRDFLDNYEKVVTPYLKMNPHRKEQVDFTELSDLSDKPFDTDSTELGEIRIDLTPTKEDNTDSFILSVREEEGDKDSVDELVDKYSTVDTLDSSELLSDIVKSFDTTETEVLESDSTLFGSVKFKTPDVESNIIKENHKPKLHFNSLFGLTSRKRK